MYLKCFFILILLLQDHFSFGRPPAQQHLYIPYEGYYILSGSIMASSNKLNTPYSNRFEIFQNELYANAIEIEEKLFYRLWTEYKMKVDWFNGLIIIPIGEKNENVGYTLNGLIDYYKNFKILSFINGIVIREIYFNHDEFIEFRDSEFEFFKNMYYKEQPNTKPEWEFDYIYFIEAFPEKTNYSINSIINDNVIYKKQMKPLFYFTLMLIFGIIILIYKTIKTCA